MTIAAGAPKCEARASTPKRRAERDGSGHSGARSAALTHAGPEDAGLLPVAADAHRAPLARVVARVVDERPAAVVGAAGLEPLPGAVGHRLGCRGEDVPSAPCTPRSARNEPDRAVLEPYGEPGAAGGGVERRRGGSFVDLDAVVRAQQLAERLAHGPRIGRVGVPCANMRLPRDDGGEPAHEAARVAQIVALLLEVGAVDEVLNELEIGHPITLCTLDQVANQSIG